MRILQLIGSAADEFQFKNSWLLGKNCPIDVLPEKSVEYDYVIYVPAPCISAQANATVNGVNQNLSNELGQNQPKDKLCWFFIPGAKQRETLPEGSKLFLENLDAHHFWFSSGPLCSSNSNRPARHPELPKHIMGPLTLARMLALLENESQQGDGYRLMVSHGFDIISMTMVRSLFEDILGIPHPGPTGSTNTVLQSKHLCRSVLENVPGLNIPKGEVLRKTTSGEIDEFCRPSLPLPFVVKPSDEDNSNGVSLCRKDEEVLPALKEAFSYGNEVIVETFIPGREIRAGAIEDSSGKCRPLSCKIEYALRQDYPIRLREDKLITRSNLQEQQGEENSTNFSVLQVTKGREFLTSDPSAAQGTAFLAPEIAEKIDTAISKAHEALGCRDFSMFDFRVHEETGDPYILEICPFWAYAPISMLSQMLNRSTEWFLPSDESSFDPDCWRRASEAVWRRAISRGR